MLKVEYEYKKGFLYVNLEGILTIKSSFELSNSLIFISRWNNIDNIVLNIEKAIGPNKYLNYILEDLFDYIA